MDILDIEKATDEELHAEWWQRMRLCAEQQTVACQCGLDERNPSERCDRCRSFADARDDVEKELRRRGAWPEGNPPRHPQVYRTHEFPRDHIFGEGKGPVGDSQA